MNILLIYTNLPPHPDGGAFYYKNMALKLAEQHNLYILGDVRHDIELITELSSKKVFAVGKKFSWTGRLTGYQLELLRQELSSLNLDKIILIYPPARRSWKQSFLLPMYLNKILPKCRFDTVLFKKCPAKPSLIELRCSIMVHLMSDSIHCHEQSDVDFFRQIPVLGKKYYWVPAAADFLKTEAISAIKQKDSFTFGFIGFWYKSKGLHLLFDAIERVQREKEDLQVKLLLIGGRNKEDSVSKYELALHSRLKKLSQKVHIEHTGFVENDVEMNTHIQSVDCLVFPFTKLFTARSSLPPAIMNNKAVIMSSPNKEVSGFVKHNEHALLVKPNSESELVGAMMRLMIDHELRKNLQLNISKLKQFYDWNTLIGALIDGKNDFY